MVEIYDSPYSGPEQVPQPRAHPTVSIICTTLIVIAVAVVVVILVNPFSEKAQDIKKKQIELQVAEKEKEVIIEKRIDKYAQLESKVEPLITTATEDLDALNKTANRLFEDIETVAHRSLEHLTAEPPNVPKDIIDANRFNEDFRRPWNELLNAYTETKRLRETDLIGAVTRKKEEKELVEADAKALTDLIDSVTKAHRRLIDQRSNLDIVRRILAQRELDALSTRSERSSP